MDSSYPNYERCRTKIFIAGEFCQCLMNEYTLCPQAEPCTGMVICAHPDKYKFAIDTSGEQPVHSNYDYLNRNTIHILPGHQVRYWSW